jgi:dipeptidyl aminopeptidase/acylaminoacyl peptidase
MVNFNVPHLIMDMSESLDPLGQQLSLQGGKLYYLSEESGYSDLYMHEIKSGQKERVNPRESNREVLSFDFSVDKKKLTMFSTVDNKFSKIEYVQTEGGKFEIQNENDISSYFNPSNVEYFKVPYKDIDIQIMFLRGEEGKPFLMEIHGGPRVYNVGSFNIMVLNLAHSLGFNVVVPSFPGTLGYGREYRRKLYGQFAEDHLEHIQEVARYIKNKYSDPSIVLSGSSFGGTSTMLNVVQDSSLFCGAVCMNGVYNFGEMPWFDESPMNFEMLGKSGLALLCGNPSKDSALNRRISPVYQVRSLPKDFPVLIMAGKNDDVVPFSQSTELYERLQESEHSNVSFVLNEQQSHTADLGCPEILASSTNTFLQKHLSSSR